ncbi:TPA: hypothetical protein DCW54_01225 [Candidatus Dependentiae bacterium]|nr:hypothetical protein [Candidatus Dependentiae bacterium]
MRLYPIFATLMAILMLNSCTNEIAHHMDKKFFERHSHQTVTSIFPTSVRDVERMAEDAICLLEEEVDLIVRRPVAEQTYFNLIDAIDQVTTSVKYVASRLYFVTMVYSSEAIRAAAQDGVLRITSALVDVIGGNKPLYLMVRAYAEQRAGQDNLDAEEQRLLQDMLKEFEREGLSLPNDDLLRVNELKKELQKLLLDFELNINKDVKTFLCQEDDLVGLENSFIQQLPRNDEDLLVVRLDMPTFSRISEYCSVAKTREACWELYSNRAYPQNYELLSQIITLRDQLAKELGFSSYAHFETDDQMAKNPETVQSFLKELGVCGEPAAAKEFATWVEQLPDGVKLTDNKCASWDFAYLTEAYKKRVLLLDQQVIKNYFPVQRTVDEMLSLYEQFLGLEFRQEAVDGVWDESVRYIGVYRSGELLGHLFLDLYPRDFKYTHACQIGLLPALIDKDGGIIPAVVAIIANFPKAGADGQPALLSFNEVKTFFHEFGHAMHSILGATKAASFSGTNVPRDFVEVPSQMFEEWLHEPAVLRQLSCHVLTGEPLPEDTIRGLCVLRSFGMGSFIQRQSALAQIALRLFSGGTDFDIDQLHKVVWDEYQPYVLFDSRGHFIASFNHISGYGSRYYSYLWSKVYAVILFSYVKKMGLFDSATGARLIDALLSRGGSRDPFDMLEDFCGTRPELSLFFKELGLLD